MLIAGTVASIVGFADTVSASVIANIGTVGVISASTAGVGDDVGASVGASIGIGASAGVGAGAGAV